MSFWSAIVQKLKEIWNKMIGSRTIEQTLHVAPIISTKMEESIELWGNMYKNEAPWLKEPTFQDPSRVVSLGLPSLIASEKARTALLEFESEITTPVQENEVENPDYVPPSVDENGFMIPANGKPTIIEDTPVSDTSRAEYLNTQYEKLKRQLRRQIEYGIAKGGLVIKPYVILNKDEEEGVEASYDMEFDFIQADAFYPLAYDAAGKITEAAFIQTKVDKENIYRRLEYHKWYNNMVEIVNKAFKSVESRTELNNQNLGAVDLGKEIPLTDVPEWAGLSPKTTVKNIKSPLFAYFRMPEANTIDPTSPLGVSGFSRAVSLIKDADMQYSRLLWEYEGGQLAIDVDRDALAFKDDGSGDGRSGLNNLQERLYRKVDLGESDTFQAYNPALRDNSYITGLNTILMRIEDEIGMSRGTISDASSEAKTATELKILKQRSYQTNADIQAAIQDALENVIYIMNVYCDLYEITVPGEYEVNYEWDDSILVDVDAELSKRITLLQNGLTSKAELRQWYFGETERQAEEALERIAKEGQDAMEENLINEQNIATVKNNAKNR